MKLFSLSIVGLFLLLSLNSCKKIEGPGGSSSIVGKIHAEIYDGAGNLLTEYDIEKEDVFIIYGAESTTFDDDVETSYDGTFKFDFLEEGSYQIFVYEKDPNIPSGKVVKILTTEITTKNSIVDLGTIIIRK
ncbi:MAG: hypothetical protein ACKVJC_03240 [Flavobacteriales bacterium]|nr:hypothetical protein [Crocinitomicaceae bacterium]|tara:strand:- start:541 stop:936 length:396 start_codon:yes stop_codon:yes gene_type:complete